MKGCSWALWRLAPGAKGEIWVSRALVELNQVIYSRFRKRRGYGPDQMSERTLP